jgi:AAA+ superfamily predicted ATPase
MLDNYEQMKVAEYVCYLLEGNRLNAKTVENICDFIEQNYLYLGIQHHHNELIDDLNHFEEILSQKSIHRKQVREISGQLHKYLQRSLENIDNQEPSDLQRNLTIISEEMGFDSVEADFFNFLIRYFSYYEFKNMIDNLVGNNVAPLDVCSSALRIEPRFLQERLHSRSTLLSSGLVRTAIRNGTDLDDHYEIPDSVLTAMQKACANNEDVRTCILGEPETASLEWKDFEHLGETLDRLTMFLSSAVQQRITGVNVLFWGSPGTGKTELCKTLAARLGLRLYSVGEHDEDGEEPTRKERLCAFQLAQNLLRYQNNSLLLFDEMDDLFENKYFASFFGGPASMNSKVFTNRLFEKNHVPTLWVINDTQLIDATILRRMSLAVEVKVPPAGKREQVWQRVLDKNTMQLPKKDIKTLAELEVPPAVVDTAARVAKQLGGEMEDFRFAIHGLVKVISGKDPGEQRDNVEDFQFDLMHTDTPLERFVSQIKKIKRKDFSLCLYGPPGTGKSAFVRHLARAMGMPILEKRASDLLDKYVGNTEKKIAAAFREARNKEAFLVFDEADSLLIDRRQAMHSWEVTQVNEMLTWMENHPLPFACTTNLMDHMDQASLRRFTFKCHCDFLSPEQIVLAGEKFLGKSFDIKTATELRGLTPGDFTLVDKKSQILGCKDDMLKVIDMLRHELKEKDYSPAKPIGFCA